MRWSLAEVFLLVDVAFSSVELIVFGALFYSRYFAADEGASWAGTMAFSSAVAMVVFHVFFFVVSTGTDLACLATLMQSKKGKVLWKCIWPVYTKLPASALLRFYCLVVLLGVSTSGRVAMARWVPITVAYLMYLPYAGYSSYLFFQEARWFEKFWAEEDRIENEQLRIVPKVPLQTDNDKPPQKA